MPSSVQVSDIQAALTQINLAIPPVQAKAAGAITFHSLLSARAKNDQPHGDVRGYANCPFVFP